MGQDFIHLKLEHDNSTVFSLEADTLKEGVYSDVSALNGAVILKNYKMNNRNILVRI
jgi:hypothetical protein